MQEKVNNTADVIYIDHPEAASTAGGVKREHNSCTCMQIQQRVSSRVRLYAIDTFI